MKYIKKSYNNHSKLYNILFLIISVGISLGLIISLFLSKDMIKNIYNYLIDNINNYNKHTLSNLLYPIIIYITIFISSLTIIGSFMPYLALFIENMSIGLILGVLIRNKVLKGLLFGIIYFIITKLLYILILIYIIINIYKFLQTLIYSIKNKTKDSIYSIYSKIIIKMLFSIITISLYNLLGIFIIPKIIKIFTFLI